MDTRDITLVQDCDVDCGGVLALPHYRCFYRIEFDKPVASCIITNDSNYQIVNIKDRAVIDFSPEYISCVENGKLTLRYSPPEPRRITYYMRATMNG
jgi:hypothetical protein